jgi:hypothetical protein
MDKTTKPLKQTDDQQSVSIESKGYPAPQQALLQPPQKSFAEVLSLIPNVGNDVDFERMQDGQVPNRLV